MSDPKRNETAPASTRREFLGRTAATAAAGGLAAHLATSRSAYAAENGTLRIGLIGCGGRGTGAARQALQADPNTKLVAMGEAFENRLQDSLKTLKRTKQADRVQVDKDHQFVGLDAHQKVIDSSDVVLIASPPGFHALQLKAAVDAGKHVFVEKPAAVDPVGVRLVLETSKQAKKKGLSVVSGLCWRYEKNTQEMIQRIHDGAIGRIIAADAVRYTGAPWIRDRQPGMTNMQWQVLNWYNFPWLSGDFNTEQFVHELDRVAWALGDEYPTSCMGTGGRFPTDSKGRGNIYDHMACLFDYEDGKKFYATHRRQQGCQNYFEVLLLGDKGTANLQRFRITGPNAWEAKGGRSNMYLREHQALFRSIRNNEPINDMDYHSNSTMMAIMQRESAYTGDRIGWDEAMKSDLNMTPPNLSWDADIPEVPPIVTPDGTKFADRTGKWWK